MAFLISSCNYHPFKQVYQDELCDQWQKWLKKKTHQTFKENAYDTKLHLTRFTTAYIFMFVLKYYCQGSIELKYILVSWSDSRENF